MLTHRRQIIPGITDLPPSARGMRIGLFGGSFNPVHDGHKLVAEEAIKKLDLDAVWVLVTPGNPLKDHSELAPLSQRVEGARALMGSPSIRVTGFEAAKGFRYSYETIKFLKASLADRKFVWIMGADNMVGFHRWERWRDIARLLPMAVYVRPGSSRLAPASRAATALARYRIDESEAATLADRRPPAWVYLHGLMSSLSSTAIRARDNSRGTK
ncbi:nicotinate-nucleotide adenylyltransferase [Devosia geojensis]|nr:nicotinate-nucleotide adenylyltransferase [Devosia geojensis]